MKVVLDRSRRCACGWSGVTLGQRIHGIWFVTFLIVAVLLLAFRRQLTPYLATSWGLYALWGPLVLGRILIYTLDRCPTCKQRPGR